MEQHINLRTTSRGDSVRAAAFLFKIIVHNDFPLQLVRASSWEDLCIAAGFCSLDEVSNSLNGHCMLS
jgi:hypothetical protein